MLASPDRAGKPGFTRSVREHNNDHIQFCDWIEGNALVEGAISYPEVVDFLIETHVYDDEGLAWDFIGIARSEIRRRARILGAAYPFEQASDNLQLLRRDRQMFVDPYVFFLLLSFPAHFQQWANTWVPAHGTHRTLFEQVAEQACLRIFAGWSVQSFGWSPGAAMHKGEIVHRVAAALHSTVLNTDIFANANDGGVDILCHKLFLDAWGGYPAIMVQCATGLSDYSRKAVEPNLDMWRRAVDLYNLPKRSLAVPFCLDQREISNLTTAANGAILDRIRLIEAFSAGGSLQEALAQQVEAWAMPAASHLPLYE